MLFTPVPKQVEDIAISLGLPGKVYGEEWLVDVPEGLSKAEVISLEIAEAEAAYEFVDDDDDAESTESDLDPSKCLLTELSGGRSLFTWDDNETHARRMLEWADDLIQAEALVAESSDEEDSFSVYEDEERSQDREEEAPQEASA